jgi:hypothetical protein
MGGVKHTEGDEALRRLEMVRQLRGDKFRPGVAPFVPFLPPRVVWHTLQDHERDSLSAPCHHWLNRFSAEEAEALSVAISSAFQKWKLRQAAPETFVPDDDIDLAFKLWRDKDPDLGALLATYPLWDVFAMIGLRAASTAAPDSLIWLNGLLVGEIASEIGAGKRRTKAVLAKATEAAGLEKKREADKRRQSAWTAARNYCLEHFNAKGKVPKVKVITYYLRKHGFGDLQETTIAGYIRGVRDEVMEDLKSSPAPRTDLYAKSQKRNA